MKDCLFCKIIRGELLADVVYQDKEVLAFSDLYPKAPVHKLVVPRKHFSTLNELTELEEGLLGRMVLVAKTLAAQYGVDDGGYRVIINCNSDGGQEIYHLHLHLLGGKKL